MTAQTAFDFADEPRDAPFAPSATRTAGLEHLIAFTPLMGRSYRDRRNLDHGPGRHAFVSRLSPYIRRRLVREEEALAAALAAHAPSACEKFVHEVFWRGYFKGWLEHRPEVWRDYRSGLEADLARLEKEPGLRKASEAAIGGRTAIAAFDAWAEELQTTGYLHNHARMWFASIWIFTLGLPWRLGANVFLRHLLDGDPASNTLSWRWVAGLHTRGKHYVARSGNIAKFTGGRFSETPGLAADPTPLDGPAHPAPVPPPVGDAPPDADTPYALVLTDEDATHEGLPLRRAPAAVAGLHAVNDLSPEGVSNKVATFVVDALADGCARAATHWSLDATAPSFDDADGVAQWAMARGVKDIVAPYAPVGPTADVLNRLQTRLNGAGFTVRLLKRDYDATVWPHATKGFFALKSKIPTIIRTLDLEAGA